MDSITLGFALKVLIVSALVGLMVWGTAEFIFKQPKGRDYGFFAFVVVALVWFATVLV